MVSAEEMTADQALGMLTARIRPTPTDPAPFHALARRLGEWPLLLELVGAALGLRVKRGDSVDGALAYVNRGLDEKGVTAFDRRNAAERHQSIARTIEASLESDALADDDRRRYHELAIFPAETSVPLSTLACYWGLNKFLDTGEKGGKAVINGYILSYDARTTNPKTRTEGRRPEQLTNQSRTAIRVQGEGLSFVTKIQPTEVEGMTSLAPGLFDIAERVRSMFSHACA